MKIQVYFHSTENIFREIQMSLKYDAISLF